MGDDVTAPLEWAAVDWGGEGVIDDEGYAVFMGHLGEAFYVKDAAAWVGDGLTEEAFGIGFEAGFYLLIVPLGIDEGAFDAEFLHGDAKEVVGAAIDIVGGDEMVACLTDIEDGIEVCCLSGAGEHSTDASFEGADLLCYCVIGRVCQTGIEIAFVFEVEEACHLVGCLVSECC